jgi:hypothetical protein
VPAAAADRYSRRLIPASSDFEFEFSVVTLSHLGSVVVRSGALGTRRRRSRTTIPRQTMPYCYL